MSHWNYVVTAQKATSITHSCTGNFTAPDELSLIIAKSSILEIHGLTPKSLQLLLDVSINGRVAVMQLFRPPGETQDSLFIATEGHEYCVLGWDPKSSRLVTRATGDVSDGKGRQTDTGQIGIIDPQCRLIGLHLYEGLFKVLPFDNKGRLKEDSFNIRLVELQVLDITFLYGCAKPTIAVLYQDINDARHVNTYEVSLENKDIINGPWSHRNLDSGADLLISVPSPLCGVLIIGEQQIVYCGAGALKSLSIEPSITKAYGRVGVDGSRYLLGDHAGQIHLLVMILEKEKVAGLKLERLGETSIASTISCLDNAQDNALVFVGSSYGDSQLVRLNLQPGAEGSTVEVLEKFVNVGPIVDFCVVDLERQGHSSVITCSGAYKDGSLCIFGDVMIINEQASEELDGIKGMWSLKSSVDEAFDAYVVVSFISQTRIYAMNVEGDELGDTEIEGFLSNVQTLFCHDAVCHQRVQVTSTSVRLVCSTTGKLRKEWLPRPGCAISVATANASQVLLAAGRHLVYLEIGDGELREVKHLLLPHEVSCLDISPIGGNPYRSEIAAVGMWTDIRVDIFLLPDLTCVTKQQLGGEIISRSVLLCALEGISYLFCALGDGCLLNFQLDMTNGQLSNRNKKSLGTHASSLQTFSLKSATYVFATSDRPVVIYSKNKMLLYVNVDLKEVSHMCPFNSASCPDSLAIAREGKFTIGTTVGIQKLRAIPIKEHARCICHQEKTRTFAICSLQNEPRTGESEKHFVRLLDDQTFDFLSSYCLDAFEYGCCILSCSFTNDDNVYYCVGTAYVLAEENEPTKGRILVFVAKERKLELIAVREIEGAAYSLSGFNGKLVAAINQKIELYKWMLRDDGTPELRWECGHHGHIVALNMQTRGDFIVVGDLMNSISLLIYKEEGVIEEIARDDNASWMAAVEILGDDTYLGADNCFNLFTVKKKNERSRMEAVGEYHIGERVNRFRRGSLARRLADSQIAERPTIIFGTVNGVVGVIASLPEEQYEFLEKLQTNLTKVIKGVGGLSHKRWRSFKNEKRTAEARSFLDGDLIESFLDLSKSEMAEISMGMDLEVEELCKRVEELTWLH